MEWVRGIEKLSRSPVHPVVTIGNFDGVHRGHQEIVRLAIEKAKSRAGHSVAYTFRPHPQIALRPGANVALLTTYDEKVEILAGLGVDFVIEEPFSREFSTIAPAEFFTNVILGRLGAEAVVVGYDFAFGKERAGHLDLLRDLCLKHGVELTVVPPQRADHEVVSSSAIREHLLKGEVEVASLLLGRPFFYRGIVMRGDGRGRKIGFPTANIRIDGKLVLPLGVYASWSFCEGRKFKSVTNVGVRPTFLTENSESAIFVETHLLGTDFDLYGKQLEVRFIRRLRDERKFSGVDELKAQIARDVAAAESILVS